MGVNGSEPLPAASAAGHGSGDVGTRCCDKNSLVWGCCLLLASYDYTRTHSLGHSACRRRPITSTHHSRLCHSTKRSSLCPRLAIRLPRRCVCAHAWVGGCVGGCVRELQQHSVCSSRQLKRSEDHNTSRSRAAVTTVYGTPSIYTLRNETHGV